MTSVLWSHKNVYPKNCSDNYMELISLSGPLTNTRPPFSIKDPDLQLALENWELYVLLHKI